MSASLRRNSACRARAAGFLFLATAPMILGSIPQAGEPLPLGPIPPPGDTAHHYLGQPRPGPEPVLFAEGVVSTDAGMYGTVVFSPEQDLAFWAHDERPELFYSQLVEGRWSEPRTFPFPEGFRLSSPFFSHDGRELYFLVAGQDEAGMDTAEKIWVVDRSGSGWGEPRKLDPRVNAVEKHWQFSLDRIGNLYFMSKGANIYFSEFRDGRYTDPLPLPEPINTPAPESGPNISSDGEMLLFDRWFQTPPYIRIMASFREPGGGWGEPIDLSPYTRSEGNDSCARLSPDGQYLFFQSVRAGSDPNRSLYWMEAAFLEGIREERSR